MSEHVRGKVVVIGGSVAGLLVAGALAPFADVVVVERDGAPEGHEARRGAPQGRHAHALLAAGLARIEATFPGITRELLEAGAVRADVGDALWFQAGAFKVRTDVGIHALFSTRPMLEGTLRRRVGSTAGVSILDGTSVESLIVSNGAVRGVECGGGSLAADLVVDCSGRHTRFVDELHAKGLAGPPTSSVQIGMAYATRMLGRTPGQSEASHVIVAPNPPRDSRFGYLFPVEEDRWILTVGGFHGDASPTDDAGFLEFLRSLPTPVLYDIVRDAEVLGPVMTHRLPTDQRRHFERVSSPPTGFVALGDAVTSFNPVYGQGMSSAALQAEQLARVVGRLGISSPEVPKRFYRAAARVVRNPWQIAAGNDFLHPLTEGPRPFATNLLNRYIAKVQLASHTSTHVLSQLQKVQNLVAAPASLMYPHTMLRVAKSARRSPALHGAMSPPEVPVTAS